MREIITAPLLGFQADAELVYRLFGKGVRKDGRDGAGPLASGSGQVAHASTSQSSGVKEDLQLEGDKTGPVNDTTTVVDLIEDEVIKLDDVDDDQAPVHMHDVEHDDGGQVEDSQDLEEHTERKADDHQPELMDSFQQIDVAEEGDGQTVENDTDGQADDLKQELQDEVQATEDMPMPKQARTAVKAGTDEARKSSEVRPTSSVDPPQTPPPSSSLDSEDEEARKAVQQLLELHRKRVKELMEQNQPKPDMVARKELGNQHGLRRPPLVYGHVPGIRVGDTFKGREEMALVNLHSQGMRGIDARANAAKGAFAIVLAGGYIDDEDEQSDGLEFIYTGEGGQKNNIKRQVKDQEWTGGNLALRRNAELNTPLRVIRAKGGKGQERAYVYEGLHKVKRWYEEKSKDGGFRVFKFVIEGIPGECTRSTKVTYKCLEQSKVTMRWLIDKSKKRKGPTKAQLTREQRLQSYRHRPGLVCEDISYGREKMPIPVFNEVDDVPKPQFTYITDYEFADAAARQLANKYEECCQVPTCGLVFNTEPTFLQGLLMYTIECGIAECDPSNPCCRSVKCRSNGVLRKGVTLPLEVFRTQSKGWGVRSSETIPVGSVIGAYIGVLITDEDANRLKSRDDYLWDMNHFHMLFGGKEGAGRQTVEDIQQAWLPRPAPPLTEEVVADMTSPDHHHLVIDAKSKGNICRLINHSCKPNCGLQPFFSGQCRSLMYYYQVVVAQRDIAPFEEITYDYGYKEGSVEGKELRCHCGAEECRGRLL